jgi:hypothetical protein
MDNCDTRENEEQKIDFEPVTIPGWEETIGRVYVFANEDEAREHVENHILDPNESAAWGIVLPCIIKEFGGTLGSVDSKQLAHKLFVRMSKDRALFLLLYDFYARSIKLNLSDAIRIDWVARHPSGDLYVALGTSGLLVLIDSGVVTTAFLPGQSTPEATIGRKEAAEMPQAQVSYSHAMRSGRPRATPHERRADREKERQFTADERLYYFVFRPALSFLRRQQFEGSAPGGRDNDYYLLKAQRKLPLNRVITLSLWRDRRKELRGKVYDEQIN